MHTCRQPCLIPLRRHDSRVHHSRVACSAWSDTLLATGSRYAHIHWARLSGQRQSSRWPLVADPQGPVDSHAGRAGARRGPQPGVPSPGGVRPALVARRADAGVRGQRQQGTRTAPSRSHAAAGLTSPWPRRTQLLIWDRRRESPLRRIRAHEAAVKAIAWSPHQSGACRQASRYSRLSAATHTMPPFPGLVASGGGTADRHIKFWNVNSGHLLNSVDTGSQVCNLAWSRSVNEIVSTHGFSLNQVVVWKYPTMSKLATLTGHSYRCATTPSLARPYLHAHASSSQRAVPRHVARWPDRGHGRGGRDASVLEPVSLHVRGEVYVPLPGNSATWEPGDSVGPWQGHVVALPRECGARCVFAPFFRDPTLCLSLATWSTVLQSECRRRYGRLPGTTCPRRWCAGATAAGMSGADYLGNRPSRSPASSTPSKPRSGPCPMLIAAAFPSLGTTPATVTCRLW